MKASTTENITGIYDLTGGVYERVAGYILNGNSYLYKDGTSGNGYGSGNLMGATSEVNPNGYQTLSTRDYTVYPYSSSSDNNSNNYNTYRDLLTSTYGYGDAILEISKLDNSLNNCWNFDHSYFMGEIGTFSAWTAITIIILILDYSLLAVRMVVFIILMVFVQF